MARPLHTRSRHPQTPELVYSYVIDLYEDEAIGEMAKNTKGAMAIVKVRLRPKITWVGTPRKKRANWIRRNRA